MHRELAERERLGMGLPIGVAFGNACQDRAGLRSLVLEFAEEGLGQRDVLRRVCHRLSPYTK